jgi:hypothetical protein
MKHFWIKLDEVQISIAKKYISRGHARLICKHKKFLADNPEATNFDKEAINKTELYPQVTLTCPVMK